MARQFIAANVLYIIIVIKNKMSFSCNMFFKNEFHKKQNLIRQSGGFLIKKIVL